MDTRVVYFHKNKFGKIYCIVRGNGVCYLGTANSEFDALVEAAKLIPNIKNAVIQWISQKELEKELNTNIDNI